MLYCGSVVWSMVSSIDSEAALLERARTLDGSALGQIHDRYYPEIYRYGLYRLGDPQAAEDVAGEVFLRLLDALHRGRAPQTTLRGWLFGVAAHLVADYFRARRTPAEPLSEAMSNGHSVAAEVEERLQRGQVQTAMRRLTGDQQQVLALRFGDGFSVEKTAEIMQKSVTAVKALQFRAVETLRRLVEVDHV